MKKNLHTTLKPLKISYLIYITFFVSIFIGAFLLFQVQPIISKYILPWFGGTSAVWITAMLFFQVLLLLGYFYVFLISFLPFKRQIILHAFILLVTAFSVIFLFQGSKIPILPDIKQKSDANLSPIIQVAQILFTGVGLTYFVLSTTSIMLQKWFGITYRGKSPYFFYSLSNIASVLALISYPFLVEPFFQLKTQGISWSVGFLVYSVFLLICCAQIYFSKPNSRHTEAMLMSESKTGRNRLFFWILLPAISSLMLMATTNLLTQSVASVPFLWLVPLSIYLISFIICFSGKKWYLRNLYVYISLITGFLSFVFMVGNIPNVLTGIIVYGLLLFSACMLCHGELYNIRPTAQHLDLYYLFIALGSAIGGLLVGIIAPLYFKGPWETYIGFYLTFLLTVWIIIYYKDSFLYSRLRFFANSNKEVFIFAMISFPAVIILTPVVMNLQSGSNPLAQKVWRNFYGILSVKRNIIKNVTYTILKNGNIIHGAQILGKYQYEPITYYGKKSGIGLAIVNNPKYGKGLNLGVIGLGSGTLAAYGKKQDKITFYEINPQVIKIANSEFTYLRNSRALSNIVLGDGRLSLEKEVKEKKEKYDILAIDAFSDDSIPLHLLTKEAFEVYLDRINYPSGIIAFHISNQYIDLKPVLIQAAKYYKLQYAFILVKDPGFYENPSEWALLSYDKKLFDKPAIASVSENKNYKEISLWTDNYSNLFQVLK